MFFSSFRSWWNNNSPSLAHAWQNPLSHSLQKSTIPPRKLFFRRPWRHNAIIAISGLLNRLFAALFIPGNLLTVLNQSLILPSLEVLLASRNQLTAVTGNFFLYMTRLRVLDLSQNRIRQLDFSSGKWCFTDFTHEKHASRWFESGSLRALQAWLQVMCRANDPAGLSWAADALSLQVKSKSYGAGLSLASLQTKLSAPIRSPESNTDMSLNTPMWAFPVFSSLLQAICNCLAINWSLISSCNLQNLQLRNYLVFDLNFFRILFQKPNEHRKFVAFECGVFIAPHPWV